MYFNDCINSINGATHLPILQQTKFLCIYLGSTRIQVHIARIQVHIARIQVYTTRIQVYIYAYLKSTKTSPCVYSVYTSNEFAVTI